MTEDEIKNKIREIMEKFPRAYFSMVFSKKRPELGDFVERNSVFLNGKLDPKKHKPYAKSTRIIYAINGFTDYPKCVTCGGPVKRNLFLFDDITQLHCCNKCAQLDSNVIASVKSTKEKNHGDPNYNNADKNKHTLLERYGVEYSFQLDSVKAASKQTLLKHYGVEHQMHAKEVVDGMKRRYKEKHGVEYAFQDATVQAKIKSVFQEKYGVDWIMQSKEMHQLMHANSTTTQKRNFYYDSVISSSYVEPLFGVDEWVAHSHNDRDHAFKWRCRKCGKEFEQPITYNKPVFARCYDCYPLLGSSSQFEREIAEYVNSLGNGITAINQDPENRNIIPPQEVDIIVKKDGEIKLLIEADGLFWHSGQFRADRFYHVNKTDSCADLHKQLIHIFNDEWMFKTNIVKSRIASLLGVYDKVVYARKCCVKTLSHIESEKFFTETHIQGNVKSAYAYGLFYNDELVSAMSFGSQRKITNNENTPDEYELLRFSSKLGYHVIGAAGKLLKHFERTLHPKLLLSYADRRWSTGKVYYATGFSLDHISKPNYWYLPPKCDKRLYRYAFRKSVLPGILKKFDPAKSEIENMLDNGYNIIWDCGNYVFVKRYYTENEHT